MKTDKLVATAMAMLLIAGCSQNEIMEISPDVAPPVGFSVYATAQTRGTETDNSTSGTGIKSSGIGFGVLGYYTNTTDFAGTTKPNFMYNQKVTWSSSTWNYTPVKYWPNTEGDKISFFGYAPYEDAPTTGTNNGVVLSAATATGYPTITFTVKDNASDMVDLVATNATQSTAGTDKTMNLVKTTGKVPFKFLHVLTKLDFYAKLASDLASLTNTETKVFIKSIELLGSSAAAPAVANSNAQFWKTAIYQFQNGKWDYTTAAGKAVKQTSAVRLDAGLFAGAAQAFGLSGGITYTTNSVAITSLNTGVPLFKANQALYLIPPTNDGITATDGSSMRVLITYDVVTLDDKLDGKKSVIETKAVASLPAGTMKPGVAYKYTFTIGIESVKVDATVDSWNTTADAAIPSVDAANATAATVGAAVTTLNGIKANSPNCNYFVINVAGAPTSTVAITPATVTYFVSGDRIELKCTSAPTGSFSLSEWSAVKTGVSVILTKN